MGMRASHQGGSVQYEDELHQTGDSGVMMLGVRNDTRTSICDADGDYTPPSFDDAGSMLVSDAGAASKAAAATNSNEPAANTAAVVTLAAGGAGVSHVLGLVAWSYDLLTVAGTLIIEDGGGTTVFKVDIPESGPGFFQFNPGLMGTANTAMIITLAAGGAGVSGIINVHTWTQS